MGILPALVRSSGNPERIYGRHRRTERKLGRCLGRHGSQQAEIVGREGRFAARRKGEEVERCEE